MFFGEEGELRGHLQDLEGILASMSDLIDDIALRQPESATRLEHLYNRLSDIQEYLGDLALIALVNRRSAELGSGEDKEVLEPLDIPDRN